MTSHNEKIAWARPDFWGREAEYVADALNSTWISEGRYVERLEQGFVELTARPHAVTASNCTTALHMAFLSLGLAAGDEVIVPGFCFQAAANVALHMGARPVFAEVDPDTWCLTSEAVERCLSPRTRIIVPVHTYGNVCAMDRMMDLADSQGIAVVEDAAEALGSRFNGRMAGGFGTIGCFSFQATKTITCGEGGMAVTEDPRLDDLMRRYRSHGMLRRKYFHEVVGHNFRLSNILAALGCAQLERLDLIIRERRRVHEQYKAGLDQAGGLTLQSFPAGVDPVLWAMAVELDPRAFPQGRDNVIAQLAEAGIETRPGFYAASQMNLYDAPRLPVCERIASNTISLPTFPTLGGDQIDRICGRLLGLKK